MTKDATALLAAARDAHRKGDNQAALDAVSKALARRDTAQAWNLKGDILLALKQMPTAVEAYAQAADLQPKHAPYWHDLGRSLLQSGRSAEADAALTRAANLTPSAWDILCDLGTAQMQQGRIDDALASLAKSVMLKPDAGLAQFNYGAALREAGRLDEAETAFKAALARMPGLVGAMLSLIALMGDRGRIAEAEQWFTAATAIAPHAPEIHQAWALALLRNGQLRDGFKAYESRFQSSQHGLQPRPFTAPRWQGEDLTGRDILIWTEQGLGDEILAASMFDEVIAAARTCIIECSDRAAPLFQRAFPAARVLARRDPPDARIGHIDFQIPASSLGGILRPTLDAFPRHAGYVTPDSALTARLRQRYQTIKPGSRLVGISWDSTARHGSLKRLPLPAWLPLLGTPGNTFVSLQYGIGPDDPSVRALGPNAPFVMDSDVDALSNFDVSAAQVAAMDLVITVSNTTAHLAGAQGIPVWTLLPDGPGCFWYWFRTRTDSPWYPAMRLFRQPAPGMWAPVMENVVQAIVEMPPQGPL